MKIVKLLFLVLLLGVCTTAMSAKTISLLSCQKAENKDIIKNIINNVETGIMNVLFDSGHIVTSEQPIIRDNSEKFISDTLYTYKHETSVQYLIYTEYNFEDTSESITYNNLQNIHWKLIRVSDKKIIAENSNEVLNKSKNENEKEYQNLGKQAGITINNIIMNDINREG